MGKPKNLASEVLQIHIEGKEISVKIADSELERERGLMDVSSLEGYDGMLFIFEKSDMLSFWNNNTLIDLDVIWIKDKKVIGVDFLPSVNKSGLKTIKSPSEADMVLELPAGEAENFSIRTGSLVSLPVGLK